MVAYSEEVATEICERISLGETVSNICKDERMPAERTVWKWRQVHPEFDTAYNAARIDQMHSWANEMITLADDAEGDFRITLPLDSPELERIEKKGVVTFKYNRAHVTRASLMIDTRKWLMARYAPDDFGSGDRGYINYSMDHLSDEELIQDVKDAIAEAGLTPVGFLDALLGTEWRKELVK